MGENIQGKLALTAEEEEFRKKCRATYNSGKVGEAYEQAAAFYRRNPESLFAKFNFAGMAGDYSDDIALPTEKRNELRGLAKRLISEVYQDERAKLYEFYRHVQNEYYWFHQLHEEQYALGVEFVREGVPRGYYSMCVGASAMAVKCLLEKKDQAGAAMWAERSVSAFHEFEKVDPDWHNINYFYADALAVLGKHDAAIAAFKDMYRKQGSPVKETEVVAFLAKLDKISIAVG
jgi:hypothetical protein